ncbi:MAG: hypothetical protein WCP33_02340 [Deltaproteobacteria bacterium]
MNAQKKAFLGGKIRMTDDELVARRMALLDRHSERFICVGSREVRKLANLFRDMELTMQFQKAGDHFRLGIEPLPLPDVNDPDGPDRILKAAAAIRDLFPKNLPGLFTIHTKGNRLLKEKIEIEEAIRRRTDLHVQLLVATKPWKGIETDKTQWTSGWDSPCEMVAPKKGNEHLTGQLAEKVAVAAADVIGKSFRKHTVTERQEDGTTVRVAVDPKRPVRTLHTEKGAAFIGKYTNEQLHMVPLESIMNPRIREEVRQVKVIDLYDRQKALGLEPIDYGDERPLLLKLSPSTLKFLKTNARLNPTKLDIKVIWNPKIRSEIAELLKQYNRIRDKAGHRDDKNGGIPPKIALSDKAQKFLSRLTQDQLGSFDLNTIKSPKIRAEVRAYLKRDLYCKAQIAQRLASDQQKLIQHRENCLLVESVDRTEKQRLGAAYLPANRQMFHELQIYVEVFRFGDGAFVRPDRMQKLADRIERLELKVERAHTWELRSTHTTKDLMAYIQQQERKRADIEQLDKDKAILAVELGRQADDARRQSMRAPEPRVNESDKGAIDTEPTRFKKMLKL